MTISNFFDKIYYINLDRDLDRKKYIIDLFGQNTSLINDLKRFPGVDGKQINIEDVDNNIISDKAKEDILSENQRIFGITLTYGSLGCALSHKNIWQQCSKFSNKPYLVFEDDIVIDNAFDNSLFSILDSIQNIDYDICYLGCNEINGFKQTDINTVIAKPSGLVTGLYGYIISPIGAKKILDTIFPLSNQIDSSIGHNSKKLNLLCAKHKIVHTKFQFGSNTQRQKSCENIYRTNIDNNWNRLFQ